ncbi:MAG: hypothetical protein PHQ23_09295 [Candidatus Wallbacteria bacterium]|nr:hypothetical protein [Candidatus Wallbacteria bacterium]
MKGTIASLLLTVTLTCSLYADMVVSSDKISERKKMAVEIISSDEGLLEEYTDRLNDDELAYFYRLGFKMAEQVAEETKSITDDSEAFEYISRRIEVRNGVKTQLKNKVESYLAGFYQLNEDDIKNDPLTKYHVSRALNSLRSIKLQRAMTSIN